LSSAFVYQYSAFRLLSLALLSLSPEPRLIPVLGNMTFHDSSIQERGPLFELPADKGLQHLVAPDIDTNLFCIILYLHFGDGRGALC